MLSMLDRKLARDLWHISTQVIAIALVIAAGIAMFNMSLCALGSLKYSRDDYYRSYRFGEVFATAKRVPRSVLPAIERIPGVSVVSVRIASAVSIDVPDMDEPANGRFFSLPDQGRAALNDIHLVAGRMVDPERSNEVLCGKSFAEAHGMVSGDELVVIINGKRQRLLIAGIALSPEFIIQIQPGSLLPDFKRYGVFWMSERQMAAAFDMEGAFNDVSLSLERGANEAEVIRQLDILLEPYGCAGAYGRSEQTSHTYISDEIKQLATMAILAPSIFLGVAAFLLNVVVSRIIGLQREQIAALKAFGYSRWAVGWHFMKLVFVIATAGTIAGGLFGYWLGINMTRMYAEIYQFPTFSVRMTPGIVLGSALISFASATLASWRSVARAMSLPPAEAMRPEPPAKYAPSFVERLGIGRLLPQVARMIIRQLERKPVKAFSAIIGIAMAVAILILGSFSLDAVRYLLHFQFELQQRQQVTVTLIEPSTPSIVHELAGKPGVMGVQPFRAVATRMSNGHISRRIGVMGLDRESDLFRLLDVNERAVSLPDDGLVLSDKLAELLQLRRGDICTLKVLEGTRPLVDLVVTGIVREYGGLSAYMNLAAIRQLTQEGNSYSGAFLFVQEDRLPELYGQLKDIPKVAGVTIKEAAVRSFEDTIAENLLTMRTFNILFAVIIAFGVVYNSARISLSEQGRDLATLRVMGFTQGEVAGILLGELSLLTLVAIPVGWVIGYGLVAAFVMGMDTELYRIPLVVDRSTFISAALVVIVAALITAGIVQRRLRHLDLIGVLKTRE